MTAANEDFRARIIAAVQAELDRHASAVIGETERLRDEAAVERRRIEGALSSRLDGLADAIEQLRVRNEREDHLADRERAAEDAIESLRVSLSARLDALATLVEQGELTRRDDEQTLKDRLEASVHTRLELTETMIHEAESRVGRRLEQVTSDLDTLVEVASRPLFDTVRDEQASLNRRVEGLTADLRSFDEQAARMVVFFNELSASIETRGDELARRIDDDVARRISGLDSRVEDAMALSLRQHVETTQRMNERTDRLEERMSQRAFAFEEQLKQEAGQRIAEIDAHLGRVAAGLDHTIEVLNERLSRVEERLGQFDVRLEEARAEFRALDSHALEELKEKLSAAVGESTLVRIDLERLQKSTTEHVDELMVRMVALEAELNESSMDVNTAVQLERLEELERALIELDPSKFVLRESVTGSDHTGSDRTAVPPTTDH